MYLASEFSSENSTLYTNEKFSYLTSNTVRQWSANCGSWPNYGPLGTFYWASEHLLWWSAVCKS